MKLTGFAIAGAILLATPVQADVAPPGGGSYVEQCTVEKKVTAASECLQCQANSEDSANRCLSLLSAYCYVKVCQAKGVFSYPEVWCRTKGSGNPTVPDDILSQLSSSSAAVASATPTASGSCLTYPPPSPSSGGGCNTAPGNRVALGWVLGVLGMGWVALLWRRRQTSTVRSNRNDQ